VDKALWHRLKVWTGHSGIVSRRGLDASALSGYHELDTFMTSDLEESTITALITIPRPQLTVGTCPRAKALLRSSAGFLPGSAAGVQCTGSSVSLFIYNHEAGVSRRRVPLLRRRSDSRRRVRLHALRVCRHRCMKHIFFAIFDAERTTLYPRTWTRCRRRREVGAYKLCEQREAERIWDGRRREIFRFLNTCIP
jgi:hypothetical protein